jgi:hypothetical protein
MADALGLLDSRACRMLSYMSIFRGVAQLVARTAGGREVAGSSPVTPTTRIYSSMGVDAQ